MIVLAVFTIVSLLAVSRISQAVRRERVRAAASVVAGDLERAFTLAARYRRPMRLSCDCPNGKYTIADRDGAVVRVQRLLGGDPDLNVASITFSAAQVDIFPSGVSSVPDTVLVSDGAYTRKVTLSTVGRVRQCTPGIDPGC